MSINHIPFNLVLPLHQGQDTLDMHIRRRVSIHLSQGFDTPEKDIERESW